MGHREYRVYAPWAGTPHQAGATYEAIYEYADREEITLGETIERAIVSLNGSHIGYRHHIYLANRFSRKITETFYFGSCNSFSRQVGDDTKSARRAPDVAWPNVGHLGPVNAPLRANELGFGSIDHDRYWFCQPSDFFPSFLLCIRR